MTQPAKSTVLAEAPESCGSALTRWLDAVHCGDNCQGMMQLPEICTGGGADTVFAHSNYQEDGKGMGRKSDDLFGAYMCRACHDEYDNRTVQRPDWMDLDEMRDRFHRAMKRTWSRLVESGVLT